MTVHRLDAPPAPELADALAAFEAQFRYPLGPDRTFRISHSEDYSRFFRAMGDGVSFVALRGGEVAGTLGAAIRRLFLPDASERPVAYFGDLKVAPGPSRGRAVLTLAQAARVWASPRVAAAFSVVMDGTAVTPIAYSGRLGIPKLEPLGKIVVFKLRSTRNLTVPAPGSTTETIVSACHQRLRAGRYTPSHGTPELRSEHPPQWLMLVDGSACGCVGDTLRAKRLFCDDGAEMRSAHLSCLAYQSVRSGAELIRTALKTAGDRGFDTLFVAIAAPEAADFAREFIEPPLVEAPATIFGTGLAAGPLWNINTAEI